MIRFDKYTRKAQEAVQRAQSMAVNSQHQQVEPTHLLVALAEEKAGVVEAVLTKIGIGARVLEADSKKLLSNIPQVQGAEAGMYLSQGLAGMFQGAQKEAERFQDEFISTEHLLLALSQSKSDHAGKLMNEMG